MIRRAYQSEALLAAIKRRLFALLFERQAGKSTVLAYIALLKMTDAPGQTVIYASASLLLGTEIVLKEVEASGAALRGLAEKEAAVLREATQQFQAEASDFNLQIADASKDKIPKGLNDEDFTDLFRSQRLEFRVYHDRTAYSRTKVIAPNVATARGWAGTVLLDEIAFIRAFMELWTAIEPIISTNKTFQLILATTPPQDDTHASYELLAAPAGLTFTPNAAGNWYESEAGIPVLRADAYDTHLAGKKIYDVKTGDEITPADSFRRAINKDGWRLNHGLQWLIGGTAAINLLSLTTAQERGAEAKCAAFVIDTDQDFDSAVAWLALNLDPALTTAVGYDVATTTKQTSNPSVAAIAQGGAHNFIVRAFIVWKTRDPDVARERVGAILKTIARVTQSRARALAIDATNEKYFAEDLRKEFRADCPVLLIVASESVEKPGLEKPTNWKEYLGDQYVSLIEDNRATLPPGAYVRGDHRLVKKDRGKFVCEPNPEGMHGDTFDAGKLALHALLGIAGPFASERIHLARRMELGRFKRGEVTA